MKSLLIVATLVVGGVAHATTLTLSLTADDYADAYISTNDSVQGERFMNKTTTWGVTETKSVTLTPNVTNYLHIRARDVFGGPSMLIAEVNLSNTAFEFANQTQTLLTNATDWKLSLTGFGSNYITPTDLGKNGTLVWGLRPNISPDARHIWSTTPGTAEHYFSVAITPVPEPATVLALGAGLAMVARRRRAR